MFTYGDGLDRLRTRTYNRSMKRFEGMPADKKSFKHAVERGLAYNVLGEAKSIGITEKAAINLVDDKHIEAVKREWRTY